MLLTSNTTTSTVRIINKGKIPQITTNKKYDPKEQYNTSVTILQIKYNVIKINEKLNDLNIA